MKPSPPADSLDSLYKGYHGWLLVWLRRRLDCPHNAADMAQDTFIRLLGAREYVAPREPRAFLATVARRLMIDRGRRQKMEQAYRDELARHVEHLEQAPSPEQILAALEALDHIARALEMMIPRARQAFILRHLEGLSHAEIAERLKVSTKTVQGDLVQALLHCHAASESAL
ncbi:sigma-70 family RNA polymerase sigma factor [Pseudomonas fontis]|uniref:Sigma-70 family RNA polymerase sigma factor n=1 Tax=Pseudomonas fontis TaxID=2942633 RepID=A0ABT5NT40_9PSED|nr:sigma-70 family RNA polymerase sigma factor [Pseudomonas fontis]MDD0975110.1 sigma-70 family RNA polymerase sigma factor [Pseudomonas fontis]MDD0991348.1 sigma-70 family RNA polymerase sigma factor [Pseudomonas fontis]